MRNHHATVNAAGCAAGRQFFGKGLHHHRVIREAIDKEFSALAPTLPFFSNKQEARKEFARGFAHGLAAAIRTDEVDSHDD